MATQAKEGNKGNILITTGIFPPQEGGPATYSKLLVDTLPGLGFGVRVVNFGDFLHHPKIVRHALYMAQILRNCFWADAVYAQDPVSVGLPTMLVSAVLRKRYIVKIVGDYAWEQGVQRSGVTDLLDEFSIKNVYGILVRILKYTEHLVAKRAEKIIVPSNYLKKIVMNWGIDGGKIVVIYNAFDVPTIEESKAELRVKFGYRTPTIVSAGRLVPWKGFEALIRIMPEILKKVPETRLLIAGSGPDKNKLQKLIEEKKMQDSVQLLGKLSHSELLRVMKAGDVFALNTSYEGFSHLILEALAVEIPVLTTSVGGNTEIIEDGKNGRLVTYNNESELIDACTQLLERKGDAFAYSKEGSMRASAFTTERMLAELTTEFQKVLCV